MRLLVFLKSSAVLIQRSLRLCFFVSMLTFVADFAASFCPILAGNCSALRIVSRAQYRQAGFEDAKFGVQCSPNTLTTQGPSTTTTTTTQSFVELWDGGAFWLVISVVILSVVGLIFGLVFYFRHQRLLEGPY